MDAVKNIRSNGLKVVGVKDWDELTWVKTTSGEDHIFIATREWKAIQFDESDVRPMGRAAAWVKWINLKDEDSVIEVAIVGEDKEFVFIVTENGMWKLTGIDEYRNQKRGGAWVKAMAMTAKTGKLISATMLSDQDRKSTDVILISKSGQTIRINLKDIRKTSRVTQWVILTKIKKDGDKVVRASLVKETDEEE